jgi:phospholipid/cholesterol/gamma-HCH transport system permease protein
MIKSVGKSAIEFTRESGAVMILLARMCIGIVRGPFRFGVLLEQMAKTGYDTVPVVSLMAMFTGMVLATQAYYQFKPLELQIFVGSVVGVSMIRELGPVLTAIICAGRVGSATTAEISTMKLTEQIDALCSLAINPVTYLATPRIVAALLMMPLLTAFANFLGIMGGYIMSVYKFGIPSHVYMEKAFLYIEWRDLLATFVKAAVFAVIVTAISCHKGFSATGGAQGVGRATTSAVVASSISILVVDYFLTLLLFKE